MEKDTFNEEDESKVVEFLNFMAKKATFKDWTTDDTVTHFKLLAHMQQQILPKIRSNILEIKKVTHKGSKKDA